MINKLTHAVLLIWAGVHYVQTDYKGSRRQEAMAWMRTFPARVRAWWPRLYRAYRYSKNAGSTGAKHKLGVALGRRTAATQEKEPERYIGKRRAPRGYRPATAVVAEPFLPPDPYAAVRTWMYSNNELVMNAKEGPHEYVTPRSSVMGRNPYTASPDTRGTEPVLTREGRGNHRRHNGVYRRRRVQWAAEGLQARIEAVYDLVQEGLPEQRNPGRHARSGLWRLPVFARRSELATTL